MLSVYRLLQHLTERIIAERTVLGLYHRIPYIYVRHEARHLVLRNHIIGGLAARHEHYYEKQYDRYTAHFQDNGCNYILPLFE